MHWGKNRSTEHSKGNKTVQGKVATTRTEDGHKQWLQHVQRMDTNSGYNMYRGWTQIVATTCKEDGHK